MPAYEYVALNEAGREQKGVMEADNEKSVRQSLRERSLIPMVVRLSHLKKGTRARGASNKEVALFTRQFATLLSAGLPVESALAAVAEQTEKPAFKGLILSVRSKVTEGHALAAALREQPRVFSELFCATVAAGEQTGHLDKVLLRLADYMERQWQTQQKFRTALIYPVMIILVAFGIVGFLLEYVVPKMMAVYGHLNQELPLLTKVLLWISDLFNQVGLIVLVLVISTGIIWLRALKKSNVFREKTQRVLLRLPWIGHAIKTANTARFSRTLSILTVAGVPILEAMMISAQLITLIPIRRAVEEAVLRVREGSAIHHALKQTTYFSPMSVHMIASGEASGQLEMMLERVALNQENDIIRLIDVGLALFEPAMIIVMGVIVLFIVLAVLLPIFQLNQFG